MDDAGLPSSSSHLEYTTIIGFFLQDDSSTDSISFDYTSSNFGLKDREYDTDHDFDPHRLKTQWERFEEQVRVMNIKSAETTQFKVLFMGRHGEGDHNVAEKFYGTEAWDCYWAAQEGNDKLYWVDAHLTETGIQQATLANVFWMKQLEKEKMPAPQSYYVSPLDRCLSTANITFSGLKLPEHHPFAPVVKELLREANGIHTCDKRSTRSYIHNLFPSWRIEPGFTEEDELWSPVVRETNSALDARFKNFLDDIFTHDKNTFVSLTSHSGAIGSILRVLGHQVFRLPTGGAIPVLVKAEVISGPLPSSTIIPPTSAVSCTQNPSPNPI